MKVVYRIVAILLTLISAGITAILISVATDENREIRVVNFTLFAIGAAVALFIAVMLWRRSNNT